MIMNINNDILILDLLKKLINLRIKKVIKKNNIKNHFFKRYKKEIAKLNTFNK
jgi:ribosomal protein L29